MLVCVWGGDRYAWGSTQIAVLIAATVMLAALLVLCERRAADPIVPVRMLATPAVAVASAGLFFATASLFAVTVFVPLFLQAAAGLSPTQAGLLLVPMMVGTTISTTLSGRSIAKTGRYKRFPIIGLGVMTVALALLAAFAGRRSAADTAACLLLFSLNLHLLYGGEPVPILSQHLVPFYMALLYVLPAFVLVVVSALRQARARVQTQRLLQELEQAHRQLADDAVRLEELTRAAERQRMARELHDTLAQGLAGLILQLEAVKAHLVAGREERALEIVIQAMGRARTSLATARSAIDDLRTETMTPTDLQHALEEETLRFTAATGIPCTTQFSSLAPVPEAFGESIMRSVAEGLLNIARHAQASQVWVCVAQRDQELAIEVRDNGRGFNPTAVAQQGHYGLPGLRERARLLDGQFALLTAPGEGTTLRFLLPATRRGDIR